MKQFLLSIFIICALLFLSACKKQVIEHYDGRIDVEIKHITSTASGKIEKVFYR